MKKNIFILTLLFSFPLPKAQACHDINLFLSNPRAIETKIVNQGKMKTCYAHSLGALYNIEKATSQTDSLHPYWVAYNHKQRFIHWSPRNLDLSLLSWSYQDIKKNGICPYNVVEAKLTELKRDVGYSDDQLIYMLHKFFQKKRLHLVTLNGPYNKALDKTLAALKIDSMAFEVPWTKADLDKIIRPIKNRNALKDFISFLGDDVFSACKYMSTPSDEKLVNFGRGFESNSVVQAGIERVLGEEKAIAIGYCPRKVYNSDPATTTDLTAFPRITRSFIGECGAHYSLLVGSRKVGNSCEVLLRNSYGEGFWGHSGMDCWCQDKRSGEQRNCRKQENNPNLRVLGCWVPSNKMAANTYDVSYFE